MKGLTQVSAVLLLALAFYVSLTGLSLGYAEKGVPGPGFMPFWIGLFLGAFSLGILWESRGLPGQSVFTGESLRVLAVITLAGAATILLTHVLGFLASLALLAGFIMRYLKGSWVKAILTATAVGVSFHFLFDRFLMVWFPTGIFGI